jgi:hypothetical protein
VIWFSMTMTMTTMTKKVTKKPPKRLDQTKLTCLQLKQSTTTVTSVDNHLEMIIVLAFRI